jgi:hypothetical protein
MWETNEWRELEIPKWEPIIHTSGCTRNSLNWKSISRGWRNSAIHGLVPTTPRVPTAIDEVNAKVLSGLVICLAQNFSFFSLFRGGL